MTVEDGVLQTGLLVQVLDDALGAPLPPLAVPVLAVVAAPAATVVGSDGTIGGGGECVGC